MPGAFPEPRKGDFASEGDSAPPDPAQAVPKHFFFSVFNSHPPPERERFLAQPGGEEEEDVGQRW